MLRLDMRTRALARLAASMVALTLLSCAGDSANTLAARSRPLRIGISANYAPVAFRGDDGLAGVEVDLAHALCKELGRHPKFVELARDELIPAVESGEIDVIMSGMSITEQRKERVLFANPYMRIGQLTLIRRADLSRFGLPSALHRPGARVGFVRETTGQRFARQELRQAEAYAFDDVEEGVRSLRANRIDFFVHDAPTIWRVALDPNESDLIGLFQPLTEEYLAWAVQKDDRDLKNELDAILDGWRANNELEPILNRWIPVRVKVGG